MKKPSQKNIFVHLGGVGYPELHNQAFKTLSYGRRFEHVPSIEFISIDLLSFHKKRPANVRYFQTDFERGLAKLADASVHAISSELALGHYDKKGSERPYSDEYPQMRDYTRSVISAAHLKLRPGGKLNVVISGSRLDGLLADIRGVFSHEKISVKPLDTAKRGELTPSIRSELTHDPSAKLFRIIAEK